MGSGAGRGEGGEPQLVEVLSGKDGRPRSVQTVRPVTAVGSDRTSLGRSDEVCRSWPRNSTQRPLDIDMPPLMSWNSGALATLVKGSPHAWWVVHRFLGRLMANPRTPMTWGGLYGPSSVYTSFFIWTSICHRTFEHQSPIFRRTRWTSTGTAIGGPSTMVDHLELGRLGSIRARSILRTANVRVLLALFVGFLLLVVRHLLLVAMHLFLIASCY